MQEMLVFNGKSGKSWNILLFYGRWNKHAKLQVIPIFFSTNCLHFTSIHPSILCPQTLADTSHARRSPVRSAGASPPPGRQPPGLKRQLIELMEKGPCMLSNQL